MRGAESAEDETAVPAGVQREAARMLRTGARTPKQLAAELGCSEQTLRNWHRQDEADRSERALRALQLSPRPVPRSLSRLAASREKCPRRAGHVCPIAAFKRTRAGAPRARGVR